MPAKSFRTLLLFVFLFEYLFCIVIYIVRQFNKSFKTVIHEQYNTTLILGSMAFGFDHTFGHANS